MWPVGTAVCGRLIVPDSTCPPPFPLSTPTTPTPFALPSLCHRALHLPCPHPGSLLHALCLVQSSTFSSQQQASFLREAYSDLPTVKPPTTGSQSTNSLSAQHPSRSQIYIYNYISKGITNQEQPDVIDYLISISSPIDRMIPEGKAHVRICPFSYPHLTLRLPHRRYSKNLFKLNNEQINKQ